MSIGVVIPVRDQERYIGEAIESVLAQTLPAQQIVVVDDGSSDASAAVAAALGAQVIESGGRGPAAARNLGALQLETEFVAFLDADDRFTPDRNAALLAAIGQHQAAQGMVREFFDPGRESELAARFQISTEPLTGSPLAMLIRRGAFADLGGFAEREGGDDHLGLARRLGEIPRIENVVTERRIHGANRSIVNRAELQREYLLAAREAILARRTEAGG